MKIESYSGNEACSNSSSSFSDKMTKFYTHENKPFQIQYHKIKRFSNLNSSNVFRSKQNLVRKIQSMVDESQSQPFCLMTNSQSPKTIFKIINKNTNLVSKIQRKIKDLTVSHHSSPQRNVFRSQQIIIQQQYSQLPITQKIQYSENNKKMAAQIKEISCSNVPAQSSEPTTVINNLKKGFQVYLHTPKVQQYAEVLKKIFPFLNNTLHLQQQKQQQIKKYLIQQLKYKNFLSSINEVSPAKCLIKTTDEQSAAILSLKSKIIKPIIIYQEK